MSQLAGFGQELPCERADADLRAAPVGFAAPCTRHAVVAVVHESTPALRFVCVAAHRRGLHATVASVSRPRSSAAPHEGREPC